MKPALLRPALLAASVAICGLFLSPQTQAATLVPGSPPTPPDTLPSISGTFLASLTAPFATATLNGTVTSEVIRANTGFLDFVIQLSNGTGQAIEKITSGVFDGFTVDAGFILPGGTASGFPPLTSPLTGGAAPATVDENINTVVGFNFPGNAAILAGQTTDILFILTNATNFTAGTIGLIDSTTATLPGFQPLAAVPLPGGLVLFGSGLAGLGLLARRRKRQAIATA